MESTLSSSCSRSDPRLSLVKVRLSLPSHDLVLWTDGSVPFLLAKAAPAYLPIALSVTTLTFSAGPVCSSFEFSAEACAILHALCWSWQHQQVCHFSSLLLSDSRSVLAALSSYPKLCGRSDRNCLLSPVLSGNNGSLDTRFFRGTMRLTSWPDEVRYLRPLQSLVVSLLLPLVSTVVLSQTGGGVLSYRSSWTHRFPRWKLVLPRHARCVFSRLRCNPHSLLLGSYLSRIGRIENPFCSACGHLSLDTSHLILHCPATDSLRRSLCTIFGPGPGELPSF